eukprot:gene7862-10671_t
MNDQAINNGTKNNKRNSNNSKTRYIKHYHLRHRVAAGKIARAYRASKTRYQLQTKVNNFTFNRAAKLIQKFAYDKKLKYLHAAKKIQKYFRKYLLKKERIVFQFKNRSIVKIQKVARGMIVRCSERFILAQIYLQLPPFWREVIKSSPDNVINQEFTGSFDQLQSNDGGSIEEESKQSKKKKVAFNVYKKQVKGYQITELKLDTQHMLDHILNDVTSKDKVTGQGILAPKLPFIVPQPFDKQPYVSLTDGRKLCFYSHQNTIFDHDYINKYRNKNTHHISKHRSKIMSNLLKNRELEKDLLTILPTLKESTDDTSRNPIHTFNVTFWPLTKPPNKSDPSTDLFDSSLNNFEVIQNKRQALYCEICTNRLRVINCSTCHKSYCYFCAFRIHSLAFKRNHTMAMIEPRLIEYKEVTKSLVFNIDSAQAISHDLKYLVKYLRSGAEVKRIQKDREMAKEFERQEEQRRIQYLKALEESKDRHNAATIISLLYRKNKARRIVNEKRKQLKLEKLYIFEKKFNQSIIKTQLIFRQFSTRKFLYLKGIKFRKEFSKHTYQMRKSKSSSIDRSLLLTNEELQSRIIYELTQRAANNKSELFGKLEEQVNSLKQMLVANIKFWINKSDSIIPIISELNKNRNILNEYHISESRNPNVLSQNSRQQIQHEILLRNIMTKIEALDIRIENCKNMRWWISQHLRTNYRRNKIIDVRFQDILERLEWIVHENIILSSIKYEMEEKINFHKKNKDTIHISTWISTYLNHVHNLQISFDSQQDSIIQDELLKLARDAELAAENDSLIVELLTSLHADNMLVAERVYIDYKLKIEVYGSEEAIHLNQQQIALKNKQKILIESVLDPLKLGLQAKYNEEDEKNTSLYSFPNDDPDIDIHDMFKINAIIIDKFQPPKHCKVSDFSSVYYAQPWLADQSVEDVRFEEAINAKEIRRGKIKEELDSFDFRIDDGLQHRIEMEEKMKKVIIDIELNLDPLEQETLEERAIREQKVASLKLEQRTLTTQIQIGIQTVESLVKIRNPVADRLQALDKEIEEEKIKFKNRIEQRELASKQFFDDELKLCTSMMPTLTSHLAKVEDTLEKTQEKIKICKQYLSNLPDFIPDILLSKIDIKEREAINIPMEGYRFQLHTSLQEIFPQTKCSIEEMIQIIIQTKLNILLSNLNYYIAAKQIIQNQVNEVNDFKNKRKRFENVVAAFRELLLANRRQRSLQLDLELRKKRLADLRDLRLRSMKEVKQKQLKELAEEKERLAKANRERKTAAAIVAKHAKKAIRAAKDKVLELKYNAQIQMDDEELRMAKNIRSKNADISTRPECVKNIHITWGDKEADYFKKQNDHLQEKGLPYFIKIERSIGNQLHIWYQNTFDKQAFITNIELSSKDPTSEHHRDPIDLQRHGYECITHEKTKLEIWVRRNVNKPKVIKAIANSYTEDEENKLLVDEYEKLDPSLEAFDLPDISLWTHKIIREADGAKDAVNTNVLVAEVNKLRNMIKKAPNDRNLQDLLKRQNEKLEEAYKKELAAEVTNPLQAAIDLLALDQNELAQWVKIFESIDIDKTGYINMEQLFDFLEEPPLATSKEVFFNLDSLDSEGKIEFGDFIRTFGTYCFFGKEEILKFLFHYADEDKTGVLTFEQLEKLLNILNPYDKLRSARALKTLTRDGKHTKPVTWTDFRKLNEQFPAIFHPAFNLQNTMRMKTIGVDWWVDKLKKYKKVRNKIEVAGTREDLLVKIELERFKGDEEKIARMQQRDIDIRNESSEVRLAILKARQFLDEFS